MNSNENSCNSNKIFFVEISILDEIFSIVLYNISYNDKKGDNMRKFEQAIISILIITCVGMCIGSFVIFITRSKERSHVDSQADYPKEEVAISSLMEKEMSEDLATLFYPGILYHRSFPSKSFTNNSNLLTNEIDKFFFVFSYIQTTHEDLIEHSQDYHPEVSDECRILIQNFQPIAKSIFGAEILLDDLQSDDVLVDGEYLYTTFKTLTTSFVMKPKSLVHQGNTYTLTVSVYTSIQNGVVNTELVQNFLNAGYISRDYYYGTIEILYEVNGQSQKLLNATFYSA